MALTAGGIVCSNDEPVGRPVRQYEAAATSNDRAGSPAVAAAAAADPVDNDVFFVANGTALDRSCDDVIARC